MVITEKIKGRIKPKIIKIMAPFRRKKLIRSDFTIISNNCWAGDVYRYYGLPYQTPTAGLFFWANDYIRFLGNLKYYMDCDIEFIDVEQSNYSNELKKRGYENKVLAKIDDVELVFLHYSSPEEAKVKWERRKKRINYENLIIKFSRQNLCNDDNVMDFSALPYKNKFFLITNLRNMIFLFILRDTKAKIF